MRLVIVTGMSGAGKSQALKIFEDFGYYCVDNLPMEMVEQFAAWASEHREVDKIALGLDVRNGGNPDEIVGLAEQEPLHSLQPEILFLDASEECLIKRFKETRRSHPLEESQGGIKEGIAEERRQTKQVRQEATYVIDTSFLLTRDLRAQLADLFMKGETYYNLNVTIMSFGFKYGVPAQADLVFDVRFLPNPYYIDKLKPLSGNDAAVADYVKQFDVTKEFLYKLQDMIRFLLPHYVQEGKNQLVIAIGCTGGRHRSVTVANALYQALQGQGCGLKLEHREL